MGNNATITLKRECPFCYKKQDITVPLKEYEAWKHGMLIQDAMPSVSKEDRETLISGVCSTCWDQMMEDVDCDE